MKRIIALIIFIALVIYLNRTYAHYYDYFSTHFVPIPTYLTTQTLNNNPTGTPLKLVTLGDSLMAGVGSAKNQESLGYQIAQGFRPNSNITLVNLAIPGAGVEDVLEREIPQTLLEKPDAVVLMIGINDVHNLKTASHFEKNYRQVIQKLKSADIKDITIINIPFLASTKILLPPWRQPLELRTMQFNSIINKVTQSEDIEVIDLYSKFKEDFKNPSDLYSYDEFHPSGKGYALWASYINANSNR